MTLPLQGIWTVRSSEKVATKILPVNSRVEIGVASNEYVINSLHNGGADAWPVESVTSKGELVGGAIGNGKYSFVITQWVSSSAMRIVGMIYRTDPSQEDDDPGTWEADDQGGGGG